MSRYVLSSGAKQDLIHIGDFIAAQEPRAAIRFIQSVRAKCAVIAVHPDIYPLFPEFGPDIRRVPFGNYLIFFRIKGGVTQIVQVIHARRDLREAFGEFDK